MATAMLAVPNAEPAREVVCIAYDGWTLFEAGIAAEVFGAARPELGRPLYRFRVARAEPGALRAAGGLRIEVDGGLHLLRRAGLVIVPGWRDVHEQPPEQLLRALRRAHSRGAQLMSICSGAFVLAATGLLDGRAATTHWRYAEAFRRRFPAVLLQPDVLYVDHGDVLTSAGSAAGIDACLHVVRRDHGPQVANLVARTMVTPPQRDATQAQFVPRPVPAEAGHGIAPVLDWARLHLARPIRVAELAGRAAMSQRTFLRRFSDQVGMTPAEWLRRERVAAAQELLESTPERIEQVAARVGFGSAAALRAAFGDIVGAPPSSYRKLFGPA
jgi:AraC family transcriptional regulator, transcriptional activator FtrA